MGKEFVKCGWHPAENPPTNEAYILLSFDNFPIPMVGRYEEDEKGGAYYAGDEDTSLISRGAFVNAWSELPDRYNA